MNNYQYLNDKRGFINRVTKDGKDKENILTNLELVLQDPRLTPAGDIIMSQDRKSDKYYGIFSNPSMALADFLSGLIDDPNIDITREEIASIVNQIDFQYPGSFSAEQVNRYINPSVNENKMNNKLRQLIRESINEYIREIDEAGNVAALEAKMNKTQEAIELREKKMNMDGLDEAYHDMLDKGKLKELSNEVKALKKSLAKYEKQLEKLKNKGKKSEEPTEEKEIVDEVTIEENDPENGPQLEEDTLNESFLHMQKLAGVITEAQYKQKLNK